MKGYWVATHILFIALCAAGIERQPDINLTAIVYATLMVANAAMALLWSLKQ